MSKWQRPKQNWSMLPHQFVEDVMPEINTLSELKVILYILRHTWGFHDEQKHITLDEFENGRKYKSPELIEKHGERMDKGCGLSHPSIVKGLKDAQEHGYIEVITDNSDKARVKKTYRLSFEDDTNESEQGLSILTSEVKDVNHSSKEALPRTKKETKKETKEKNFASDDAVTVQTDDLAQDKTSQPDDLPTSLEQPSKPKPSDKDATNDPFYWIALHAFKQDKALLTSLNKKARKRTDARIGMVLSAIKAIHESRNTPLQVAYLDAFKVWYEKAYKDQSIPRDANKWSEYYLEFYAEKKREQDKQDSAA